MRDRHWNGSDIHKTAECTRFTSTPIVIRKGISEQDKCREYSNLNKINSEKIARKYLLNQFNSKIKVRKGLKSKIVIIDMKDEQFSR